VFTLDQLRSFVAVAEELHFGRAAERLSMTQPPLSRQVQALERILQAQLFDRSRRSVQLTHTGQAFLVEARRILALTDEAVRRVDRARSGISGSVRIGFTSVVGHAHLPTLLRLASERVPDVEIILHEMVSSEQSDRLASGAIDIGLGRYKFDEPEYDHRALQPEHLVHVQHEKFETTLGAPVTLRDLNDRDFIGYTPGDARYFHDLVAGIFVLKGIHPRYVQRITQIHTMIGLVEAGLGAALVPGSVRSWGSRERLRFTDIAELREFEIESRLTWRVDSTNPALHRLLEALAGFADLR
jgi:DNA-binding transcriptional LysR family regulator